MSDKERIEINAINMMALKNEKLKWNRLHERMTKLLESIKPIEDEILKLYNDKIPIMDDITNLRIEMVATCVHPKDMLVHNGDHILCKFCDTKLSIPTKKREPDGIKDI